MGYVRLPRAEHDLQLVFLAYCAVMSRLPPSAPIAQSTNSVLMIRPSRFYPNPETAIDNAFQSRASFNADALGAAARSEFDAAVQELRDAGLTVHLFQDTAEPEKPDAVFPNNWISTHHDGRVALFPMYSELRRRERRHDIIEELRKSYKITEAIDNRKLPHSHSIVLGGLVEIS